MIMLVIRRKYGFIGKERKRMGKKICNSLCICLLVFLSLSVLCRGSEVFSYDYIPYNIDESIIRLDGAEKLDNVLNIAEENNAELVIDLTKGTEKNIYGISIELSDRINVTNFRAFFSDDLSFFSHEDEYLVYMGKENILNITSTQMKNYLLLRFDQSFEIKNFNFIIRTGNNKKVYMSCSIVALILFCPLLWLIKNLQGVIKNKLKEVKSSFLDIIRNKKVMLTLLIIFFEIFIVCAVEIICYLFISGTRLNPYRAILIGTFINIVTYVMRHKKSILKYFAFYYFLLIMLTGTINIISAPHSLGISWDDEIHFSRSNYYSRMGRNFETEAEYQLKNHYIDVGHNPDTYPSKYREEWDSFLSDAERDYQGLRAMADYKFNSSDIAYIPAAVGLMLGRGLELSIVATLQLGKWLNLFCYAVICGCAVFLLKERGRLIVAFIGLIPMNVFIASNYSYDWVLTSLTLLGYAMFEHQLQNHKKISIETMTRILVVMFIAILVKPVYFFILFPMLLLNSDKYENSKKQRSMILITMLLLVFSVVIPMLFTGKHLGGDTRGGDVNPIGQIKFILTSPIKYSIILGKFMWKYLDPDSFSWLTTRLYAYGEGAYFTICLLVLTLGTLADSVSSSTSKNKEIKRLRWGYLFSICAAIVFVTTAIYVSFNPVMNDPIKGMQKRYLMPVIFPLLFYVFRVNIDVPRKIKDNVLIGGCMILVFVLYYNLYTLCIRVY